MTRCTMVAPSLLLLVLVAVPATALQPGQERDPDQPPPRAVDRHGDPLPDGAVTRFGTLRWRHSHAVFFVSFLGDGKELITGSSDGMFHVWKVPSGERVRSFGNETPVPRTPPGIGEGQVRSAVLSPDRKTLAIAAPDGSVQLWHPGTGKQAGTLGKEAGTRGRFHGVNGVAFAPDSKTLAERGNDHVIRIWDLETFKQLREMAGEEKGRGQVPYYGGIGNSLAFAPDGKSLLAINTFLYEDARGVIVVWDPATGKEMRRIDGPEQSLSGRLAVHGDIVAAFWGGDRTLRLYEIATGKELRQLDDQTRTSTINTFLFAADGKTLITRSVNTEPAIRIWDPATGKVIRGMGNQPALAGSNLYLQAGGFGASCLTAALSPDGTLLAEALATPTIRLWQIASGKQISQAGHTGEILQLVVPADGKSMLSRGRDGSIRRWELATGKELASMSLPVGAGPAVLSADGTRLVFTQSPNKLHIWDPLAARELSTIELPGMQLFLPEEGIVPPLALSSHGKLLAVQGEELPLRIHDTATGKLLSTISPPEANPDNDSSFADGFEFTPDETGLLTFSPEPMKDNDKGRDTWIVRLWQPESGKLKSSFRMKTPYIAAFAFSPDSQLLIVAHADDRFSVWELLTGKECLRFPANAPRDSKNQAVLAISKDGRILGVGSDNTLRLFDLGTGKELAVRTAHPSQVTSLALTPDSRYVLTGSADTTSIAWDLSKLIPRTQTDAIELTPRQLDDLWVELAGDPDKAYRAATVLASSPVQAAALVGNRLKPVKGVDPQRIAQLVAELDSNNFVVRERATEELARLGELAHPALKKVLAGQPSLEARQRAEKLLERGLAAPPPSTEVIRALRAIRLLEQLGIPPARSVLQELARGAAGDRLTRSAESALHRLAGRQPVLP